MKLRNIKYFLSESIRSIVRNRLMALASIITVASCILILAISYFLITNVNQMLEGVERSMSIIVFIDNEASDEDVFTLEQEIQLLPNVVSTDFASFEDARERASIELGIADHLLEGLPYRIFPRSFTIILQNIENQSDVVTYLEGLNNIDEILHDQEGIDAFIDFSRTVTIVGIVAILFLGAVSTIIIVNTIKITVSARKNEINIMKYVGATDSFIRWPFLMEGILIGVTGAGIALGISYIVYTSSVNAMMDGESMFNIMIALFLSEPRPVADVFVVLIPICLGLGTVIGIVGSVTSIRRYLRV